MRLWNLFSDVRKFGKKEFLEYKEWLLKNVGVSQHRLKTRIAFTGKEEGGWICWLGYL
jgi:hypothetical protein